MTELLLSLPIKSPFPPVSALACCVLVHPCLREPPRHPHNGPAVYDSSGVGLGLNNESRWNQIRLAPKISRVTRVEPRQLSRPRPSPSRAGTHLSDDSARGPPPCYLIAWACPSAPPVMLVLSGEGTLTTNAASEKGIVIAWTVTRRLDPNSRNAPSIASALLALSPLQ